MVACRTRVDLMRMVFGNFAFAGMLAAFLTAPVAGDEPPHPKGRLVGTVTVRGTNQPVAGARIRANIGGMEESRLRYAHVEATSDANGRYVLELPMGHASLINPILPSGYFWTLDHTSEWDIVTTPEAPEHTKHYQLQRGVSWRVRVEADEETVPFLPDVLVGARQVGAKPSAHVLTPVDKSGLARLTLPEAGGEYRVRFFERDMRLVSKTPAKLSIEPGFQPERATRNDETAALTFKDDAGQKAVLTDGGGAVVGAEAEIRFDASALTAEETFSVTGEVVDDRGEPLVDAFVGVASTDVGGSTFPYPFHSETDQMGRVTISGLSRTKYEGQNQELFLIIRREGFAGVQTEPKRLTANGEDVPLDFGTITLSPGHQVRLRVFDPDGKPVLGAWVEASGNYAKRAEFARTDTEGRCWLNNLPPGINRVSARFGGMRQNVTVVVTPDASDEVPIKLNSPRETSPTDVEPSQPLVVGETVPEWEVTDWMDGTERKLSDYCGKVVVIHVWGVWSGASLQTVPILNEVEERFQDQDVVFLGIHTAGTQLDEIRSVMKYLNWDWPTGLDAGDEFRSGMTVQRYGVRTFPMTIVIARDGKVAMNDAQEFGADPEAGMKEMERIAKELDLCWPLPDAPEQAKALLSQMFVHRLSKGIEAALEVDGKQRTD